MNDPSIPASTLPAPAAGSDRRLVRRWIRINYGLNRREKGRMVHAYGKIRCKGDWSEDATHRHIRALILKRHTGWMITGYALISPNTKASDGAPTR